MAFCISKLSDIRRHSFRQVFVSHSICHYKMQCQQGFAVATNVQFSSVLSFPFFLSPLKNKQKTTKSRVTEVLQGQHAETMKMQRSRRRHRSNSKRRFTTSFLQRSEAWTCRVCSTAKLPQAGFAAAKSRGNF